jgi:predicted transcriptional regulator
VRRGSNEAPQYLLLPIDPKWALAILEGSKKWELRTKRPSVDTGDIVVLYATTPLRAIVGSFRVGDIVSDDPETIWRTVRGEIASSRPSYIDAFGHLPVLHAIQVKSPRRLDPYTPRFKVGQGWRFLRAREGPGHRSVIERVRASR